MSELAATLTPIAGEAPSAVGAEAAARYAESTSSVAAAAAGFHEEPPGKRFKSLRLALSIVGVVALVGGSAGWSVWQKLSAPEQTLLFYSVSRSDLPINITERGNLESQQQTIIRCEVENLASSAAGNGTQILSIVSNGKAVEEGEVLIELDRAPLAERLDTQTLATTKADTDYQHAQSKRKSQEAQNDIKKAEAKLKLDLAKLEREMYDDKDSGTFRIAVREIDLKIEEAKNQIDEARAALELQKNEHDGIEKLYRLGYRGAGDLRQARYKKLQAEDLMTRASNVLTNGKSNRTKLTEYEYKMKVLELDGKFETASRGLDQVEVENKSLLDQAIAAEKGAEQALGKEIERREKYKKLLDKCTIRAPHAGMAVYFQEQDFRGGNTAIGEGAMVRERQQLLTLPNLKSMQVKTTVHESVLDQVKVGLPVTIKIDAFPDQSYRGRVKNVAVLPRQGNWLASDIKVYETIVTIDEEVTNLKPGMTAVVEIHVDVLKKVLSVPVQAIMQVDGRTWVWVKAGADVEKRPVKLGRTNDKVVEIVSGVTEGDEVVLNPMAIVDDQEENDENASPGAEAKPMPGASPGATAAEPVGGAPVGEKGAPGSPPQGAGKGGGMPGGKSGGKGGGRGGFDLASMDKDGDGKVSRSEAPEQFGAFFDRIDANSDGFLDAAEMQAMRNRGGRRQGGGEGKGGGPGAAPGAPPSGAP